MKARTTMTLVAMILIGAGCGKQEDTETAARPPRVPLHAAALQGTVTTVRRCMGNRR